MSRTETALGQEVVQGSQAPRRWRPARLLGLVLVLVAWVGRR